MTDANMRWQKRTTRGVRMVCISCKQMRWCHPECEMCGVCVFGEAGAEDEFDELSDVDADQRLALVWSSVADMAQVGTGARGGTLSMAEGRERRSLPFTINEYRLIREGLALAVESVSDTGFRAMYDGVLGKLDHAITSLSDTKRP